MLALKIIATVLLAGNLIGKWYSLYNDESGGSIGLSEAFCIVVIWVI